jgi:hypothetical protein
MGVPALHPISPNVNACVEVDGDSNKLLSIDVIEDVLVRVRVYLGICGWVRVPDLGHIIVGSRECASRATSADDVMAQSSKLRASQRNGIPAPNPVLRTVPQRWLSTCDPEGTAAP